VYRVLFEASAWQATLGQRWLNIYVTSDDGMRISLTRSLYRWLAKWVFGCLGGSFVSLGTILATANHKALHDYFGKTVVVRGRPLPGGMLEPWRIAAAFAVPFVWMMGTFLLTL
jgi:uncharacterized RDD family membrane protein YckC